MIHGVRQFLVAALAALLLQTAALAPLQATLEAQAQAPAPAPPSAEKPKTIVPLKIQVVISRYQGDRMIGTMPYTMSVSANESSVALRMGTRVPVVTQQLSITDGRQTQTQNLTYMDTGTNIDCGAVTTDDGRFRVSLSIEDSSIADPPVVRGVARITDSPNFRSFRSTNSVVLRDGQSTQLVAASDKINGDVVKVEVTLNVER